MQSTANAAYGHASASRAGKTGRYRYWSGAQGSSNHSLSAVAHLKNAHDGFIKDKNRKIKIMNKENKIENNKNEREYLGCSGCKHWKGSHAGDVKAWARKGVVW